MRALLNYWLASLLLLSARGALAQGLLVNVNPGEAVALPRPIAAVYRGATPRPMPPSSYKIKELSVQVRLTDQVARTQISQSFVNTGSAAMEVCFVFPLPYDGAIEQMTLLVDGKEHPARLLAADAARKIYEEIVRKNRDPAFLEWIGTGMFKTSVFPVPGGAERKVTLSYSQLCRKDHGLTDLLLPLSTAKYTSQPVEKLDIQVAIESGVEIKNVYSPSHAVDVKRPDNKHAAVSWTALNQLPGSDFRLLYDVGTGEFGTSVLSYRRDAGDDGYFLLLASPEIQAAADSRPQKSVIFVVDRSGSMSGEKINQAKGALKFVLNNLRAGDLFNIIAYDGNVESFRPELQRFDEQTRASALGFVDGLFAGGSTNIDAALSTALAQLKDSSRASFVIFLTDGLPTAGETNEAKIVAAAQAHNSVRARVFAFGVGYDVNSRLLDKLARENFGQSEYVRPSENIEARVSKFYARIDSPVMTNATVRFALDNAAADTAPPVNRVYPAEARDLFSGEQLVVVGRYRKSGAARVTLAGKVGQREQAFDFPAQLVEKSTDETNSFIEKLWAMRRVGQIIDELDLHGRNEELVKELVELSTRHGILTPYTSFLADETTDRHDLHANAATAGEALKALSETNGESGVAQRGAKGYFQRAEQPADASGPPAAVGLGTLPAETRNFYFDAKKDKAVAVDTVQNVGRKTFYRRSGRWIDGSLSKEQESQAIKLVRFSPDYFKLIEQNGKDAARYLSLDEPVTVEIGGQAYAF
jgi:Ca-activated chloride channel homolog